jgi:hypothetical protein
VRKVVRLVFVLALGALGVVAVLAWLSLGAEEGATWTTTAAALAVLASLITAWNGQRAIELQEDAKQPYPYPYVDTTSRYSLMQLRVTNYGGSVALNISLEWNDEPLLNDQGQQVKFTEQEGAPDIAVLLPGQSVAARLGVDFEMYSKNSMNYSGIVKFSNASGKAMKHSFFLSAEQYRGGYSYEEEGLRTHYELQRIPKELKKLNNAVKRLWKQ